MILLSLPFITVALVQAVQTTMLDEFREQTFVDAVKRSKEPTVIEVSRFQQQTNFLYRLSFSLFQVDPPLGELLLFQPLPVPLIRKDLRVDNICLVFGDQVQKALHGSKFIATISDFVGSKVEFIPLDLSEPCGDLHLGYSLKSNSRLYHALLNASTENFRIDISNLHANLLPDTNSNEWFKLLIETSLNRTTGASKQQKDESANWAENILGVAGRHKRQLEVMSCGEETSCCGSILKIATQDLMQDMVLGSNQTSVVAPRYYTTMQCQGWCPSRSLHHYVDVPSCRPSKYGNGTVLYKREDTRGSDHSDNPHFEEIHLINWNVTECSCT